MEEFPAQPDRRVPPRYAVDEFATLVIVNSGTTVPGRIVEISLDGCRVCTGRSYSFADCARVEVIFKINSIAFRLGGVMRWADAQTVGIAFAAMTPRRREAMVELLAELEDEERARAAIEAAETAVAQQPTAKSTVHRPEFTPEPVASVVPAPGKPGQLELPSIRHSAPAPASPPTPKRERRGQARHAVDTKATIFLIDVRAQVSGRIADLSLSGCRIGTDERFPVGIYRRVETEFRLDGLPFRLGGVVQSLHDKFTVGIRFLDMSERKHDQLVQLIEEIDAASAPGG